MLGNLRADIPPEPEPARGSAGLLKQLRALPWLWFSALGVKRAGDLGTSIGHKIVMHRKSYKEFVMGQAAWGKKTQVLQGLHQLFPKHLLSHCQAAVFSPYLMFYYTSWKGLQGHLREFWSSHRLAQCLLWR